MNSSVTHLRMTVYKGKGSIAALKNSEYDQEIPQSQTADKPIARQDRATYQSMDTMMTNCILSKATSSLLFPLLSSIT